MESESFSSGDMTCVRQELQDEAAGKKWISYMRPFLMAFSLMHSPDTVLEKKNDNRGWN